MSTRLKLLTVGVVLVTAAVAGCSSTAGSSGAMQDDASSAASSPASTGPAPSPDPVTPTVEPTEAAASPVASPTDSASVSSAGPALLGQTMSPITVNNDVCAPNLAYACGSIGPGTGIVFYASATPFACGAGLTSSCNFLEAAQNGWNGPQAPCIGGCVTSTGQGGLTSDWGIQENRITTQYGPGYPYCNGSGSYAIIPDTFTTSVGSGYSNTTAMITMCTGGSAGFGSAGNLARSYGGGGMTNWSLPSLDELNALFYYTGRNAIGGFAASYYWSSSQQSGPYAWAQSFESGYQSNSAKTTDVGVRPVRAF
jgi:hypothetical protein